jgi:hypothetical protein
MTPSPGAWRPSVIGAAYVIASAPGIVRPISNLDRDRAWIGAIARGSGISGSVSGITSIIIGASASSESDSKQKE